MIHSLIIESFRMFNNQEFKFGKRLTAIAGVNAIGKSTLLGIIGHMVESKKKNIFGKTYRTEFSEIFKTTITNDPTGTHKGEIHFSKTNTFDEISASATFRSTWQNKNRFRIIPKRTTENGIKTESKYPMPVQYLGLSRLYPLGETGDEFTTDSISTLTKDEKSELFTNYKEILSLSETITDISTFEVQGHKSNFIGIDTNKYDKFCNSAGQDNLGQILLTLKSFQHLKDKTETWNGGLLLIDEIESTLHPLAQTKLIKFLFKQAKSLELQIIFTTHSAKILKDFAKIYEHNPRASNDYKTIYISKANGKPKIYNNPRYELIKNNLHGTLSESKKQTKLLVYSEDDTSRWFLKKIIHGYVSKLKFVTANFGCNQLEKMLKEDQNYFSKVIILVDGDVNTTCPTLTKKKNVITLPSNTSPERVLYDYLISDSCEFWERIGEDEGFTKEYLLNDNGPLSSTYSTLATDRKKFAAWFEDHKSKIEHYKVIEHWKNDNQELYQQTRKKFIDLYNNLTSNTI